MPGGGSGRRPKNHAMVPCLAERAPVVSVATLQGTRSAPEGLVLRNDFSFYRGFPPFSRCGQPGQLSMTVVFLQWAAVPSLQGRPLKGVYRTGGGRAADKQINIESMPLTWDYAKTLTDILWWGYHSAKGLQPSGFQRAFGRQRCPQRIRFLCTLLDFFHCCHQPYGCSEG